MTRKERMRYWKITAEETDNFDFDESKLLNWEIKCIREPEEEAHFIGVFMYRNGTAYDYESVKGICYFYNNIDRKELPEITKFLRKYNGKEMETEFNTKAIISLEFEDITAEALKEAGMPESKLLPIPK